MIFGALQAIEIERRKDANIAAITNAQGWTGLFNGFAGENNRKARAVDMLPYLEQQQATKQLSEETRRTLKRLNLQGKIPTRIWASLQHLHQEIEQG